MNHHFDHLSIFATTRCNLGCAYCACRPLMDHVPGYSMGLDELGHFVERCEALGVYFAWAWFTGGEPTLWPNLVEGIRMLAGSPAFGKLRLNTNGAKIERLEPVWDLLANARLSVYPKTAGRAAELIRRYPKLRIWAEPHRKLPDEPVPGSLPASCICPIPSYFAGRVYVCPGGYAILAKLGRSLDDPELSCSVDEDFPTFYRQRLDTRRSNDICQWCISNGNVYRAQRHTQLAPVVVPGCEMAVGRKDF